MENTQRDVLNLLSKKYTYNMLKSIETGPKRFKDLSAACKGEKMRTQRLREFEHFELVKVKVKRMGRRPVSFYELSETGKGALKLAEDVKKLYEKS